MKYPDTQPLIHPEKDSELDISDLSSLPDWNSSKDLRASEVGKKWMKFLASHGVVFSSPIDLDFEMMTSFPAAYGISETEEVTPEEDDIVSVLGPSHGPVSVFSTEEKQSFAPYRSRFKRGSKPASHLDALAKLDSETIQQNLPESLGFLLDLVRSRLEKIPE